MNNVYLIVGASGSGKDTLTQKLSEQYDMKAVKSYTTRHPRYEGEDTHIFVSQEEFDQLKDIVAYTEFHGHRYCATAEQIDNCDLYVIDPKGVEFFKEKYHNKPCKIIYLRVSLSERYERMKARVIDKGTDFKEAVETAIDRILNDVEEFYQYEHKLVPIDLDVKNEDNIEQIVLKVVNFINKCENGEAEEET